MGVNSSNDVGMDRAVTGICILTLQISPNHGVYLEKRKWLAFVLERQTLRRHPTKSGLISTVGVLFRTLMRMLRYAPRDRLATCGDADNAFNVGEAHWLLHISLAQDVF